MSTPSGPVTPSGAISVAPTGAVSVPSSGAVSPSRLLPDLATVLLCAVVFVRPLYSAQSLGTVIAHAGIVCAGLAVFFQDWQCRRPWRSSLVLMGALLAWIAGLLYASREGVHPGGLEKSLVLWGGFAVAAVAAHRLSDDPVRRRLLIQALIAGGVLLAVYGLEEQYLERPARIFRFDHDQLFQGALAADVRSLAGQERYFNPRIAGAFLSSNLMGAIFMASALAAVGLGAARWRSGEVVSQSRISVQILLLVAPLLTGLWMTGSKGAWLGLLCGLAVWMVVRPWRARPVTPTAPVPVTGARHWRGPAVMGVLLAGLLALPVVAQFVTIDHPLDFTADGQPAGGIKSALVRVDYWQTGWKILRDNPLGIGPDQIQQRFSQYRSAWALETPIDLHHEFFEILVEGGPLALLGALGIFGWIVVRSLRQLRDAPAADAVQPPELQAASSGATAAAAPAIPLAGIAAAAMGGLWLVSLTVGWTDSNREIQPVRLFDGDGGPLLGARIGFLSLILATVGLLCYWVVKTRARHSSEVRASQPAPPAAAPTAALPVAPAGWVSAIQAPLLAAFVAILIHSGFDFILQNGAVLLWAALLAGLVTAPAACTIPVQPVAPAADGTARRQWLRGFVPSTSLALGALFLAYLGVYKPVQQEAARSAAEALHAQFELFPATLPAPEATESVKEPYRAQLKEIGDALMQRRVEQLALSPDDLHTVSDFHLDLSNYYHLARACGLAEPTLVWLDGVPHPAGEVLEQLGGFLIAMNPYDGTRWFYAGRLYLTLDESKNQTLRAKALEAFQRAAAIDPQRPLLHLMVGDCRLQQGDQQGAAQAYAAAWQAQWSSSVPETQFYGLYYDANPEILPPPETRMDVMIVGKPSLLLHDLVTLEPSVRVALLRRYWVALRAVQASAGPLPPPIDPAHPTQQETAEKTRREYWAAQEKQTLEVILQLRPGSVDTQLLFSLRDIATAPAGSLTDNDLAQKFTTLRTLYNGSTVDRPLPGTIDRIEQLVRHPPRQRYTQETPP